MNKITTMLVAFAMIATMIAPAVSAQDINVEAAVSSSGTPPSIDFQWALSVNESDGTTFPGDDGNIIDMKTQVMPIAGIGMTESEIQTA